jgi:uracil-DNA glycosylase
MGEMVPALTNIMELMPRGPVNDSVMLMAEPLSPHGNLRWHLEAGVDETIGETPVDRYATAATPPKQPAAAKAAAVSRPPPPLGDGAVQGAHALAAAATTVDELHQALMDFDGCPLRKTATNLVFGDGNPIGTQVLFIGEAPGAEEDRQGKPFVGPSGRLLDLMLESIGLDRTKVFISNTVFWRPPGNRNPTMTEMVTCMPFVERLVELIDPRILVALGGPAAKSLLAQSAGISRIRGHWYTYATPRMSRPVPATAIFHPAYLLRTPGKKREAWRDLLGLKNKLASP